MPRPRTITAPAFTLIEAIIAIVVLSVAVPSMFWALRDATVKRLEPAAHSRARWLANERLEQIIADRHSSTRGYAYVVNANYPAEASFTNFPGFTRSVSITETSANLSSAGTGYKKVAVSVGFPNVRGGTSTLVVTTVVTDY